MTILPIGEARLRYLQYRVIQGEFDADILPAITFRMHLVSSANAPDCRTTHMTFPYHCADCRLWEHQGWIERDMTP